MKRVIIISVIISILLSFSSCNNEKEASETKKPRIVSLSNISNAKIQHKRKMTVIIDPGHGFDDPGSVPEPLGCKESDITLKASVILAEELQKIGIDTIMTHRGESYISEQSLMKLADDYKISYDDKRIDQRICENNIFSAYERYIYEQIISQNTPYCFFISLHTNTAEAPDISGASIDFCEENDFDDQLIIFSEKLSESLYKELNITTKVYRDEYSMAYIVTKYPKIPSVLIEIGYGSNPDDASKLNSDEWLRKFCTVLADEISKFNYRTSSETVTNSYP